MTPKSRRMLRFLLVGGVGFLIDAGVLTLLAQHMRWPLLLARLGSFGCASVVTWLLNRALVFGDRREEGPSRRLGSGEEYLRYMAVQIAGATTNLLVFLLLTAFAPALAWHVVVPLAIGSITAAVVTFTLLNTWLYSQRIQQTS